MCKIIDGFGPHVSSETAMQIYYDKKIVRFTAQGGGRFEPRQPGLRPGGGQVGQAEHARRARLPALLLANHQRGHRRLAARPRRLGVLPRAGVRHTGPLVQEGQPEPAPPRQLFRAVQAHLALPAGRRGLVQGGGRA
eukprot:114293-Prymnesium_polylepis.2